jgi:cbb3-type cytochrome oxidase subunit 1
MTLPLRYFLVALGFLLAGAVLSAATAFGWLSGLVGLAHLHVLLAGWVCLTIMGAMTQFVPVWSARALHSRRLATVQLWLVVGGLTTFVVALLRLQFELLAVAGAAMLLGFWLFVYNLWRTLPPAREFDVTEGHFAFALLCVLAATGLGLTLAVDFATGVLFEVGIERLALVRTHATLAVFGIVGTTVIGALYQLATMFTQTDLGRADEWLQQVELFGYPAGVLALAAGRLLGSAALARVGAVGVVAGMVAVAAVVGDKLLETQVDWTPMLSRYAVVVVAVGTWAVLTLPAWLAAPLAPDRLLAAPGAVHLLLFGVVGFVVLGTLYHVVPFIVWVHRYSDLLGYEPVPMIDDLYSDRIAAADFGCLLAGLVTVFAGVYFGGPTLLLVAGGAAATLGAVLFTVNMLLVLRRHSPRTLAGIVGLPGDHEREGDSRAQADGE